MNDPANIYQALGRIEGIVGQILAEQKKMREDFNEHCNADQQVASSLRMLVYKHRDDFALQLAAMKTAKAVLRGQLTLGQRFIAYVGSFVLFAIAVYEAYKNMRH